RVYVRCKEPLSVASWLDGLKAGRNQATNGPLLNLRVNDREIGDTLKFAEPGKVKIEATATGRLDFQELQLVHNGKVIRTQKTQDKAPFRAKLSAEVRIEEPGWFAVRIVSTTMNELGYQLFAHTSPIYVELAGKTIFDADSAQALLRQIEEGQAAISKQGQF